MRQTPSPRTWDCVEAMNPQRRGSNARSAVSSEPLTNRARGLGVFFAGSLPAEGATSHGYPSFSFSVSL
jgi:hypothetical protein